MLATLLRLLHGDFELAEEALHEAFAAALRQWPQQGVPDNPRAWLVSAGRFKAIDHLRKRVRQQASLAELAHELEHAVAAQVEPEDDFGDDRLRLIFTCCHPSLSREAQVALTLREVCGLATEAIAAAFLVPVPTLAQRIVRAKNKIRDAAIPYEIPGTDALPGRLDAVLQTIYLVFNEGYSASAGDRLVQVELCAEAIRLGRLLQGLLPQPEVTGLLALMLLHDARRPARADGQGELVPLEEQDRSLWHREQIREGSAMVVEALQGSRPGPFAVQAAIAALHAEAPSAGATDWGEIAGLYSVLLRLQPSPVVELNRAVAVAMRDGPAAGLELIDQLETRGALENYYLLPAARADLYRRDGKVERARQHYERALALVQQDAERRFLQRRLQALDT